jgi:hypothetical protein
VVERVISLRELLTVWILLSRACHQGYGITTTIVITIVVIINQKNHPAVFTCFDKLSSQ